MPLPRLISRWSGARADVDEDPWIYESPDDGMTVYRRPWRKENKELRINGEWHDIIELSAKIDAEREEAALREQHPPLRDAWEQYQTLLMLYRSEEDR